jgi:L-amino acid N-acyltransferase YncA
MAVETRSARTADVPEIARLVAAMAAYHESLDKRACFDWEEIRQAPVWLQTVLARDHHALWVADAGDGHLAGYLWVRLLRDHSGYLPRVRGYVNHAYLEEHWRGKGLIRPMLDAAYE